MPIIFVIPPARLTKPCRNPNCAQKGHIHSVQFPTRPLAECQHLQRRLRPVFRLPESYPRFPHFIRNPQPFDNRIRHRLGLDFARANSLGTFNGRLTGTLFDQNTNATYDPANYAGHGNGLFFVAVEDGGGVFAFALRADGTKTLIAEIDAGLPGVMALDYDTVLDVLWAVCDDGCAGTSAQIALNGSATPAIAHFARPATLPNVNNEGFATAPAALSTPAPAAAGMSTRALAVPAAAGERAAWWFADGINPGALHTGTLPAAVTPGGPTDPTTPADPADPNLPGGEGTALPEGGIGTPPGELATTGSEAPNGAIALALMFLVFGAAALVIRRRTRNV